MNDTDHVFSNIKICIIGNPTVGKTSLRRTYIGESFRTNYIETIGSDFSFTSLEIEDRRLGLSLWDLAGQEKFLSIHPLFYTGSYGCIVVYAVNDRDTFDKVEWWIDKYIEETSRPKLPIMMLGNKVDLIEKSNDSISKTEHLKLVNSVRSKYPDHSVTEFRTSAKKGNNVHEAFVNFANEVYHWIVSRTKDHQKLNDYEDDINKNIPGAYLFVMNQIVGPQLVASVPSTGNDDSDMTAIMNSGVKLIAGLDFNDVISQSSIISTFPWIKPPGNFHYIAFALDNVKARGKKELYVLGINTNKMLNEPIRGIKGVLNGLLYNALNEVVRVLSESNVDVVTSATKINDLQDNTEFVGRLHQILNDLRLKTNDSIKRWHNIPQ